LAVIIVCPLRIERRGAGGKIGLDHAGDDGARHVEIERSDGRIHCRTPSESVRGSVGMTPAFQARTQHAS
jgi:hypothetical protein